MERSMCLSSRAERLFVQIPICIAVVFGLSLMLPQFILAVKERLVESPIDWMNFLLFAVLVGSVSLIIIAGLAAVGTIVGVLIWVLFAQRQTEPHR